jgi:hypothetical protein
MERTCLVVVRKQSAEVMTWTKENACQNIMHTTNFILVGCILLRYVHLYPSNIYIWTLTHFNNNKRITPRYLRHELNFNFNFNFNLI